MKLPPPETLQAPSLDVMNFLNEVTLWYPSAISFAPGRPAARFFDVPGALNHLSNYARYQAEQTQQSLDVVLNQLGQYQKTNGIINDLICRFLAEDEDIHTTPEAIMITDGCQEGMTVLLAGLFKRGRDVLVVIDPTYTGITGISAALDVELYPVPSKGDNIDLDTLAESLQQIRASGKHPRALYVTPDFNNPLGTSMSPKDRQRLLDLAYKQEMLIFEDNAYGMFTYEEDRLLTLKALDREGVVIYLGTFSKILFPALRLGFLVADQEVVTAKGSIRLLAEELSKVKSFTTVSTSALSQAVAGGILLAHTCSLRQMIQEKVAFYRLNRDVMLECLEQHFGNDPLLTGLVSWNRPKGGFFLSVDLPFPFTAEIMQVCAQEYGVICCPMTFFSLLGRCQNQVRLSFSYVSPDEIRQGIIRFWRFVRDRVVGTLPPCTPERV